MATIPKNGVMKQAEAYADGILERLSTITELLRTDDLRERVQYHFDSAQAATNLAEMEFEAPAGFDWLVERISLSGDLNAFCIVYLDEKLPVKQIDFYSLGGQGRVASAPGNVLYIPAGRKVIFQFYNVAGVCTVNVRVKAVRQEQGAMQP